MVLDDVDRMFIKDTTMPITKDMILEVYGMCQMTVVAESDSKTSIKEY